MKHLALSGSLAAIAVTATALTAALALPAARSARADTPAAAKLLNVSYDPTRELYAAYNRAFSAWWQKKTGQVVTVDQSHGGSGSQARAVIQGLDADVVTLGVASDVDAIAKTGAIASNWESRLPHESAPYTSTVVFIVRHGNPKHIRDWDDIVRPGVSIVTPNPKTSSGGRWAFLGAWVYAQRHDGKNENKSRDFERKLYHNVAVLDAGARGSTDSFAQRGIGDVLLAWENEAYLLQRQSKPGEYEIIVPSISVFAQPSVAWVDANIAHHHTEAIAHAYLEHLYSPEGQAIACREGYRPLNILPTSVCPIVFPKLDRVSIDTLGGWGKVQSRFFGEGGIYDTIAEAH